MTPKTFAEALREARVRRGLSLRDLAKPVGVSPSYLSDIECGRRDPSEGVIETLARVLVLDFDELMALSGRFGTTAERYFRLHPAAGRLLRLVAQRRPDGLLLERIVATVECLLNEDGK